MFKLLFIAVFLLVVSAEAANPGIKVGLNVRALNFAAQKVIDLFAKKVPTMKLPEINERKTKLSARITKFVKPSAYVTILPGSGLRMSVWGGQLGMYATAKKKVWWFWMKANLAVSSNSISMNMNTNIYQRSGKPQIQASSCSASLGGLRVKLSGSVVAWLVNFIMSFFKGTVKRYLEKEMCKAMINVMNVDGNKQLSSLNLVQSVGNSFQMSYSLTANPSFLATRVETSHSGKTFYDLQTTYNHPFMSMLSDRMVTFSVSEETLNGIARVVHRKGVLTWNKNFVLGNQQLKSTVKFTSAPVCKISPSKVQINTTVEARIRGANVNVLIKTQVLAEANVYFYRNNLKGSLSKIDVKLIETQPSLQNITDINSLLDILEVQMKPVINIKLMEGFPLPNVKGATLSGARIRLANRYIQISTNVY